MAYATPVVIASATGSGSTGLTGQNTTPYAGGMLAFIVSGYYQAYSLDDSLTNSWHQTTQYTGSQGTSCTIFWAWDDHGGPLSTGSSHDFTVTGGQYLSVLLVGITGNLNTSEPGDQTNGANADNVATTVGAAVTPTTDNQLILTGVCAWGSATSDLLISSSGFAKIGAGISGGGTSFSGAVGYVIQTSAAVATATWTTNNSLFGNAMAMQSFKVAPATAKLRRNSNLTGMGASGPFFQNPLGAKSFSKKGMIYVPKNYVNSNSHLSL